MFVSVKRKKSRRRNYWNRRNTKVTITTDDFFILFKDPFLNVKSINKAIVAVTTDELTLSLGSNSP